MPRGRVYHMYASRCSDDRVIVLNPASFGKLVRILFPNLQTRRLGVRGESKYHYVNFDLREHPTTDVEAPLPTQNLSFLTNKDTDMDVSMIPTHPADESGAGHLPSPADLLEAPSTRAPPTEGNGSRSHSRYNVPRVSRETDWTAPSAKTPLKLSLMTEADKAADLAEPVVLPDITPYLPPQTDPDAAQSLMALYRSHCTSIIESLRYCREKSFFHLYACFHGTLTMPVQRTFAHPKVAAWIEKCDIMLYQRCTRLISHLSHQVIPQRVMASMRKIAEQLVGHIQESFRGQPEHVLDAKIGPATIFAGILDRMLRVNVSAHAMVREMSNGANRDQMFADWVQKINPRKIAECVPTRGMDDLVRLLVEEMRDLLSPEHVSPDVDTQLYPAPINGEDRGNDGKSHLERFERFLLGLPQRFPYASHADIAWCVERVGTTIVRDMTLGVVPSYSSWWVVKVFLDEEIWFLAEAGGFLRTETIREITAGSRAISASRENGRQGSAAENERTQSPQAPATASPGQSDRAPFPPKQHKEAPTEAPEIHDDSGIGIRTPDTDYPMDKFNFGPGENAADLDVDMETTSALVQS